MNELSEMRTQSREYREAEAQQQDVLMEWESKLHDKTQEMNLQAATYEKKVKSMATELEEWDISHEQFKETISELNKKCTDMTDELETVTHLKNKYLKDSKSYMLMNERLVQERSLLEERQDQLTYEIQRLEVLAENNEDLCEEFPQDFDNDLDELEERSYESGESREAEDEDGDGEGEQEDGAGDMEFGELEGLGATNMNDDGGEKDYVETNVSDMRRTKDVNAAMVTKLAKQEETKEVDKRPSRLEAMRNRQSVVMSRLSFAPMKPIVQTRAIETQTESEPLK